MPLLRFDGYYVLSDLTGVPDILSRIKPIFRSLVPAPRARAAGGGAQAVGARRGHDVPDRAGAGARRSSLVTMVMGMPRMLATTYDSLGLQLDRLRDASGPDEMALGGFQILALVHAAWRRSRSASAAPASGRAAGCSAGRARARRARRWPRPAPSPCSAASAYVLWPNGDYEPIRPGERGTIGEAVKSLPNAAGGRPSFTPERAAKYAPVPTGREARTPLAPETPPRRG